MRKRRVVGRTYRMKYSWKGHKDRNRHKNRIKRSEQVPLVYVIYLLTLQYLCFLCVSLLSKPSVKIISMFLMCEFAHYTYSSLLRLIYQTLHMLCTFKWNHYYSDIYTMVAYILPVCILWMSKKEKKFFKSLVCSNFRFSVLYEHSDYL